MHCYPIIITYGCDLCLCQTYPNTQENLSHCLASVVRRPYLVTSNVSTKTAGPIGIKPGHNHNCSFSSFKI